MVNCYVMDFGGLVPSCFAHGLIVTVSQCDFGHSICLYNDGVPPWDPTYMSAGHVFVTVS